MARVKGIISISANAEPQIAAPWDGRDLVPTKAELYLPATWTSNDGNIYVYDGMSTKVTSDGVNNGLYILSGTDYTNPVNWNKIGGAVPIVGTNGNIVVIQNNQAVDSGIPSALIFAAL
jgi:hypothetical protein